MPQLQTFGTGGVAAPAAGTFTTTTSDRFTDHIIRVGVNYKFTTEAVAPVVTKH